MNISRNGSTRSLAIFYQGEARKAMPLGQSQDLGGMRMDAKGAASRGEGLAVGGEVGLGDDKQNEYGHQEQIVSASHPRRRPHGAHSVEKINPHLRSWKIENSICRFRKSIVVWIRGARQSRKDERRKGVAAGSYYDNNVSR